MAKLTKAITGVPDGEIYPREIPAGEDCPASLVGYAQSVGAFDAELDRDVTLTLDFNVLETPEFKAAVAEVTREAEELIEKATVELGERRSELDNRETALDQRAADLDNREADLAARITALDVDPTQDDTPDQPQGDAEASGPSEAMKPKGRTAKANQGEPPA